VLIVPALLIAAFAVNSLRGPAPASADCSWTGTWSSPPGTLTQNGSQVTGDDGNSDLITGTVSGNVLTGQWTHGTDFGAVIATMDPSCNSFTGFEGKNGSTSVPTSASGSIFNRTRSGGGTTTTPPASNADLTGLWQDDTNSGATYRVRQIGSQFYWSVDNTSNGGYYNVYVGKINGSTITGGWVDLPGSPSLFSGSMYLRIDTPNHLVILKDSEAPCCYGANELFRQGSSTTTSSSPAARLLATGGCTAWNGTWDSDFGTLKLTTNGSSVSGTYIYLGGKMTGKTSGNQLAGTWSQQPTYKPPDDAGDLQFTFNGDGSFSGQWRNGSSGDWQSWNGTCSS
jgi:hypothetical protein